MKRRPPTFDEVVRERRRILDTEGADERVAASVLAALVLDKHNLNDVGSKLGLAVCIREAVRNPRQNELFGLDRPPGSPMLKGVPAPSGGSAFVEAVREDVEDAQRGFWDSFRMEWSGNGQE